MATSFVVLLLHAKIYKVGKQDCDSDVSQNWADRLKMIKC